MDVRGNRTSGDPRKRSTELRGGGIRAGLRTYPDGSDEVFAGGQCGSFRAVAHAELGDEVGYVGFPTVRVPMKRVSAISRRICPGRGGGAHPTPA